MTSSARASTVAGMSRPSALAVLRLMTTSTLVDCWTGKVGRVHAFEDTIDIAAAPVLVGRIRPVGDQAAQQNGVHLPGV